MTTLTLTNTRSRSVTAVAWTLQILCAALFLFAGGSKLAGVPAMVQTFEAIGVGQWFRYVTGAIEVVAAVLLLVPSVAVYGAIALVATMVGAVATHLFVVGGSPLPAIVAFGASAAIAWLRRSDL